MKKVIKLDTPPVFTSYAAVGGYEEGRSRIGDKLDLCDPGDSFGQKTHELAEGEMAKCALNIALSKAELSHEALGLIVAGDLQNQCIASALGLGSFGAPFLGVYGACSTATESLLLCSALISLGYTSLAAAVTSSHNSAAEKQFRTPLEYGGQRAPSAQWTSTASGAFILSSPFSDINAVYSAREKLSGSGSITHSAFISEFMIGKVVDGSTKDGSNMGGAMAFAAAESIISYFEETGYSPSDFDYIVTGDLGRVGKDILCDILESKIPAAAQRHTDCGLLLYDSERQDVHSGASGCGTSAALLSCHFLPLLERGDIKNILFLSTGALMSPSSILQGSNILGVAPAIRITSTKRDF